MAASGGFSFGFVLDEQAEASSDPQMTLESKETALSRDNTTPSSPSTRPITRPFSFFDSSLVEQLLRERALEEIIHDELKFGDTMIRRVDTERTSFVEPSAATEESSDNKKLSLRPHHPSDLVPGVYEGGAAVWEGCLDLVEYLSGHFTRLQSQYPNATIMELGCGHALPALLLLQALQPRMVVLTDYNEDVLKDVTISNLVINFAMQLDEMAPRVLLGAGDWMDMSRMMWSTQGQVDNTRATSPEKCTTTQFNDAASGNNLPPTLPVDGRFDLLLAAETLYTPQAASETAYLVAHHLADNGTAFIATKRYYFGVGGGTDAFVECATYQGLVVETVQVVDTGRGNVREVLKVTH